MSNMAKNRIEINVGNGFKIVAEQNPDSSYDRELYVGIEHESGAWVQDLAIIRQDYKYNENDELVWKPDMFEVLVYGDPNNEDWTNAFQIGRYEPKEEE